LKSHENSCQDENGDDTASVSENESKELKVEDEILSDGPDGEKAVYVKGEGIKILGTNDDDLRNIDDILNERCGIPKPKYRNRARTMCMEFCYAERALEVFSDEEGVHKEINGYCVGDYAHNIRRFAIIKKQEEKKNKIKKEQDKDEVPKPVCIAPNAIKHMKKFEGLECPITA